MTTLTEKTAQQLAALPVNHRVWFWFCANATPPLLVEPMGPADAPKRLKAVADTVRPADAAQQVGVGAIGEDGRMRLTGTHLDTAVLTALSAWVQASHADHPGLAVLADTMLLTLNPNGSIDETLTDDALWTGIQRPEAPGSLSEAAARLRDVDASGTWVWLIDQGPGGTPGMLAIPCSADPKGEALKAAVQKMLRRSERGGRSVSGTLRRSGEQVVLITDSDLDLADELRQILDAHDPAAAAILSGCWLVQLTAGQDAPTDSRPPLHEDDAEATLDDLSFLEADLDAEAPEEAESPEDDVDLSVLDGLMEL